MNTIYDLLNDAEKSGENIERIQLSELEKKNIYHSVMKRSGVKIYGWKKRVAAAAVLFICTVGAGITATASVRAVLNKNRTDNYKEEVNTEITKEPVRNGKEEGGICNAFSEIKIRLVKVARIGNEINFTCDLTFEQDIVPLIKDCGEQEKIYSQVWEAKPFANSYVAYDAVDTNQENLSDNIRNPIGATALVAFYDTHTVRLKVVVSGDEESFRGNHNIKLCFKDIAVGDDVIKGEWTYTYDMNADRYEDMDVIRQPIALKGTTSGTFNMQKMTIDSYALTQNGIMFYGTDRHVEWASEKTWKAGLQKEKEDGYLSSTPRLHLTDNLGNEYLMYPLYQNYHEVMRMDKSTNDFYSAEDEALITDKELEFDVEYSLYDGPAIYGEEGKHYLIDWDPNAEFVTVIMEEEVSEWESDGKTLRRIYYQPISEKITVSLNGTAE